MYARVALSRGCPVDLRTWWTIAGTSFTSSPLAALRCRRPFFLPHSEQPPPATVCCPQAPHLRCNMPPGPELSGADFVVCNVSLLPITIFTKLSNVTDGIYAQLVS